MAALYDLHRGGTGQFHWDLRSANNQRILSSELYNTKAAAQAGILACRQTSGLAARYTTAEARDGKPYFVLKGANGEVIGVSERTTPRPVGITALPRVPQLALPG